MVVTVTLNPALDVTARAAILVPGGLNRLEDAVLNAGGKGVNAARLVQTLGGEVLAVGFAGGAVGEVFSRLLTDSGLPNRFIPIPNETRVNMKVIGTSYGMTELNCPGGAADEKAYRAMEELLLSLCGPGTVFVFSGSLPPGAPAGLYGGYIRTLRARGAGTVLDASGEALRLGVLANPDIVKPNREEMTDIAGIPYEGLLVESLGADGARFHRHGQILHVPAHTVDAVSPAGAGDCMTGALAYALDKGLSFDEDVTLAMAASAAAVTVPGTGCPPVELIRHLTTKL